MLHAPSDEFQVPAA